MAPTKKAARACKFTKSKTSASPAPLALARDRVLARLHASALASLVPPPLATAFATPVRIVNRVIRRECSPVSRKRSSHGIVIVRRLTFV
jgi:hypothetical protein